jgi:hypothetical protein
MHGMTDLYDALAGEIMRMMEDDRGLVRSKLADLLEKEVGNWKPDISIGMVASASDHTNTAEPEPLSDADDQICDYVREQYRKYLAERARQQTLHEFYGRNRNDICGND